jgi:protein SCO1/2
MVVEQYRSTWRRAIGRPALLALVAVIALGLGWAALRIFTTPYVFHGSLIEPPVPAADFGLTDQDGQPFRLSDQRGKVVVLTFGYTSCPDVCPATIDDFRRIRKQLGGQTDGARFVMVTIDPQRDTPVRLREYMAKFDPALIGLTGDTPTLRDVWRSYGVYQAQRADLGSIEHSSRVYVVDTRGNLRLTFSPDQGVDALAEDIRHLIDE